VQIDNHSSSEKALLLAANSTVRFWVLEHLVHGSSRARYRKARATDDSSLTSEGSILFPTLPRRAAPAPAPARRTHVTRSTRTDVTRSTRTDVTRSRRDQCDSVDAHQRDSVDAHRRDSVEARDPRHSSSNRASAANALLSP